MESRPRQISLTKDMSLGKYSKSPPKRQLSTDTSHWTSISYPSVFSAVPPWVGGRPPGRREATLREDHPDLGNQPAEIRTLYRQQISTWTVDFTSCWFNLDICILWWIYLRYLEIVGTLVAKFVSDDFAIHIFFIVSLSGLMCWSCPRLIGQGPFHSICVKFVWFFQLIILHVSSIFSFYLCQLSAIPTNLVYFQFTSIILYWSLPGSASAQNSIFNYPT